MTDERIDLVDVFSVVNSYCGPVLVNIRNVVAGYRPAGTDIERFVIHQFFCGRRNGQRRLHALVCEIYHFNGDVSLRLAPNEATCGEGCSGHASADEKLSAFHQGIQRILYQYTL
ncbi:hypothetical protein C479_10085 [Halovivax asiaticus JCM 14624]|uniref:Uncharacterized protein n=1 Tax=Halovivax asiaticus JCM 14624 TaxID=1227490 RepID=M0BJU7_9EURY|nr:hypothetical protein C479_10085 [Halovivax asiaticus JCM 14624]